ncbi:MAG: hypothetical protein AAB624_01130 [Patescibacteria group bacterium]
MRHIILEMMRKNSQSAQRRYGIVAGMSIVLDSSVVLDEVNRFHVKLANGVSFWAPYLANHYNHSQDPNIPRGLGKASSDEIEKSANYIVSLFPNASSEEIRQKLIDGSLAQKEFNYKGVDCSGFAYHVMHALYQKVLGKELMDDLSVPKDDVLNGAQKFEEWKSAYLLSNQEAEELQDDVPMRWVVETFKRKPVNLCRAAGLMSDFSSIEVPVSSMQIGDLVDLFSREGYGPHLAIVCSLDDGVVSLAHSGRKDPSDTGGVLIEEVPFDKLKIDTSKLQVPRDFRAIRRLKSFK